MSETQTLRRGMRPEDIGALRYVHDTRVSPDGASVAFTVTDMDLEANRYRSRVWLASTDGQLPAAALFGRARRPIPGVVSRREVVGICIYAG